MNQNNEEKRDNSNPDFIKEIVKKKSEGRAFFRSLCMVVIIAAAAAFVAAFVFAFTLPLAKNMTADENKNDRITIPGDENTSSASASVSTEEAPEPTTIPQATQEPTEEPQEDMIERYTMVYEDMKAVSEDAQKAIVTVTGIITQKDYFDQAYESEQKTSGFIVGKSDTSLYILTDYSVLENVERIQVEFVDGYLIDGIFQKNDPDTGLAVIKADIANIPEDTYNVIETASLGNSLEVHRGDPVIALGSPLGYSDYLSYGMITSVSNTVSVYDGQYNVFTTNITGSQKGNGVILDLDGDVIGIIISGQNDVSETTINAYSVSQIKSLIEDLSNNTARPLLGIKGAEVNAQTSQRTGVPAGVLVSSVKENSPAMLAGLMENDVIVGIDETAVATVSELSAALNTYAPGEDVVVRAMRKGTEGYQEVEFNAALGEI